MVMFLAACTKIAPTPQQVIDLGVQSQATSIKSVVQINNTVTYEIELALFDNVIMTTMTWTRSRFI